MHYLFTNYFDGGIIRTQTNQDGQQGGHNYV
nr:MAG TPA: hypothetical protein [Caudoviricetes sp.]